MVVGMDMVLYGDLDSDVSLRTKTKNRPFGRAKYTFKSSRNKTQPDQDHFL